LSCRLKQIDLDGTVNYTEPFQPSMASGVQGQHPAVFALERDYPNPFNPASALRYQLSVASDASPGVYDILGREVATLLDERMKVGIHEVKFDAAGPASGVYFYQITAGHFVERRSMIVMK
jgi:hypothetical protein